MKITVIICLTAILLTALICKTWLVLDYQRTEQFIRALQPSLEITPNDEPRHL